MSYPNRFGKGKRKPAAAAAAAPRRRNKNQWHFNNSHDCCKEVWEMGERYMATFQAKETRPRRHMKYPALLTKYTLFLYLTGARAMEPILSENMQLEVKSESGNNYIYVKRVNEKHFEANKSRQQMEVVIPIFCEYERRMWKYITNKGLDMNTKLIFQFDNWGKLTHDKLNRYVGNFKTDLRDDAGSLHRGARMTPHILRHMRAFNLLINHRAPDALIVGIMGWDNNQMLYYYAHIRTMMKMDSMLKLAKESGFLSRKFDISAPDAPPTGPMFAVPSASV